MKQNEIPKGGSFWERTLYQSDAFLSLSRNGMKYLFALMDVRERRPTVNKQKRNGRRAMEFTNLHSIQMPYTVLKKTYGMNDDGIARAKDELLAKGFIEIKREGGTGQHDTAIIALIEDYKSWKLGEVMRTRTRDIKRGYQGKRLGATAPKGDSNETRSEKLRLAHAVKPETKTDGRLRKPETKIETETDGMPNKTAA